MKGTTSLSTKVAICVAAYKRPDLLSKLLKSLDNLFVPTGYTVELRVVDNDSERSAELLVSRFREYAKSFDEVHYSVQKIQNIALARNAALDIGHSDYIVFIDDDEVVSPDWLHYLLKAAKDSSDDAVFGPVRGRFKTNTPQWIRESSLFHKPVAPTGSRIDWKQTRTSNTLVKGSWFYSSTPNRFDPSLGRSGGSDSNLFSSLQEKGATFSTCQNAIAWEDVPSSRANLIWLVKRWYRNGLIYERIARKNGKEISPTKRFFRRCGAAALHTAKGIPSLIAGKPESSVKGLLRLALAYGGIKEWLFPDTVEKHVSYQKKKAFLAPKTKLAFLTNIISPYRAPVFHELHKRFDLKVFVDANTEFDRNWKTNTLDLKVKKTATFSFKRTVRSKKPILFKQVITFHIPVGLFFSLVRFQPQKVISHELGLRTAIAALYCTIFRKPLTIWSYQSRISGQQGSWRSIFRKLLLARANRVVGMGIQAREVLENWGVDSSKIVDAPNAANHLEIDKQLANGSASLEIQKIRQRFAQDKKMAVVVGRLIPLKGITQILDAWKQLPQETREQWNLLFVGSGPLSSLIEEVADPQIQQVDNVTPEKIAFYYAAADLHIFPTCGDVWGLVVNEASHCGTPTLCSPYAGCSDELITPNETGLLADFTDSQTASEQLDQALKRKDLLALGIAARHRAASFTIENLAQSFVKAVS